jgi:hypothetical protein
MQITIIIIIVAIIKSDIYVKCQNLFYDPSPLVDMLSY